ncbi:MAG: hypothetical protein OXE77_00505 [Flavobacteriaceae bacterium]|nr:hypothetical protein [Flavobacteriaceae bacterium]
MNNRNLKLGNPSTITDHESRHRWSVGMKQGIQIPSQIGDNGNKRKKRVVARPKGARTRAVYRIWGGVATT